MKSATLIQFRERLRSRMRILYLRLGLAGCVLLVCCGLGCRTFNYTEADLARERGQLTESLHTGRQSWGLAGGVSPGFSVGAVCAGGLGGAACAGK